MTDFLHYTRFSMESGESNSGPYGITEQVLTELSPRRMVIFLKKPHTASMFLYNKHLLHGYIVLHYMDIPLISRTML